MSGQVIRGQNRRYAYRPVTSGVYRGSTFRSRTRPLITATDHNVWQQAHNKLHEPGGRRQEMGQASKPRPAPIPPSPGVLPRPMPLSRAASLFPRTLLGSCPPAQTVDKTPAVAGTTRGVSSAVAELVYVLLTTVAASVRAAVGLAVRAGACVGGGGTARVQARPAPGPAPSRDPALRGGTGRSPAPTPQAATGRPAVAAALSRHGPGDVAAVIGQRRASRPARDCGRTWDRYGGNPARSDGSCSVTLIPAGNICPLPGLYLAVR
jgi:hypothetical protein